MNDHNQLSLRLARLKPAQDFEQNGDGLIFLFCKGGRGLYGSNAGSHRFSGGDILVYNGAAGAKIAVLDGKGEMVFWHFSVSFENLLPLFSGEEISLLREITDGYKVGKLYPASTPLAVESHRLLAIVPTQFNLDHRGQLVRIAATILSAEFGERFNQRQTDHNSDNRVFQIFEKLSADELINLSVPELAKRFCCSRRHLNRLFHQHFGVAVASLRMEMRLLKAVSLLRDPDSKIVNVAQDCGFNHLGLFNMCFKRRFGTSPGQWRKSIKSVVAAISHSADGTAAHTLDAAGANLAGSAENAPPLSLMTACANKIFQEDQALGEFKRQDLILGIQSLANMNRDASAERPNV